jgi:hypothetical protein
MIKEERIGHGEIVEPGSDDKNSETENFSNRFANYNFDDEDDASSHP